MSAPTRIELRQQAVTSVTMLPLGYDLTLECGHVVFSAVKMRWLYCAACAREALAQLQAERAKGGRP